MNWLLISTISVLLLALIGGGVYYYLVVMKSDANCCPKGYTRNYKYGVHVAAKCDKDKTKKCQRCIGNTKPPSDWNGKVDPVFQGGVHVVDADCGILPH